jgi:hypothetical protein
VKIVEPGSVATNFAPRSGAFMQQTAPMPTYDEYVEKVKKMFGSMRGQPARIDAARRGGRHLCRRDRW